MRLCHSYLTALVKLLLSTSRLCWQTPCCLYSQWLIALASTGTTDSLKKSKTKSDSKCAVEVSWRSKAVEIKQSWNRGRGGVKKQRSIKRRRRQDSLCCTGDGSVSLPTEAAPTSCLRRRRRLYSWKSLQRSACWEHFQQMSRYDVTEASLKALVAELGKACRTCSNRHLLPGEPMCYAKQAVPCSTAVIRCGLKIYQGSQGKKRFHSCSVTSPGSWNKISFLELLFFHFHFGKVSLNLTTNVDVLWHFSNE